MGDNKHGWMATIAIVLSILSILLNLLASECFLQFCLGLQG